MEAPFIPTYSYWFNKNSWYGSMGQARFFIQPTTLDKEDPNDPNEPVRIRLDVQLWRGPLTLSLSEVLSTESFLLLEDSADSDLAAMSRWLEEQAVPLNQPT